MRVPSVVSSLSPALAFSFALSPCFVCFLSLTGLIALPTAAAAAPTCRRVTYSSSAAAPTITSAVFQSIRTTARPLALIDAQAGAHFGHDFVIKGICRALCQHPQHMHRALMQHDFKEGLSQHATDHRERGLR